MGGELTLSGANSMRWTLNLSLRHETIYAHDQANLFPFG
jgi:hypothetical protein